MTKHSTLPHNVTDGLAIFSLVAPLGVFALAPEQMLSGILLANALSANGLALAGTTVISLLLLYIAYRRIYADRHTIRFISLSIIDRGIYLLSSVIAAVSLIAILSHFSLFEYSSTSIHILIMVFVLCFISYFSYEHFFYNAKSSATPKQVIHDSHTTISRQYTITFCILIISMVGVSYIAPETIDTMRAGVSLLTWNILYNVAIRQRLLSRMFGS